MLAPNIPSYPHRTYTICRGGSELSTVETAVLMLDTKVAKVVLSAADGGCSVSSCEGNCPVAPVARHVKKVLETAVAVTPVWSDTELIEPVFRGM